MADLKPQKYRDKKTGRIYTEWKDSRGKIRRKYEQDDRGSSYHAAGSSARREEQTTSIPRTTPPSYYQQTRDSSSVREPTTTEETYAEYPERGAAYQIHDSSRGTEYYAAVGYDQPQAYPNSESHLSDPSEGTTAIDAGMRNLELDDHYSLGSSPPQSLSIPYGHGSTSLQTSQPPSRHIRGTEGQVEKLDKSYRVRNTDFKKFFHVGRVFSTLWTEGVGLNSTRVDPTFISEVIYQERVHSKVRRFVVVKYREGDRSCTCLPVTSYDGWGPKKRGITLGDHGFIYSKDTPYTVQGLLPLPLKVVLSPGNSHLQDQSLVNYRKVYTIETNVKVKDVGHLDRGSMTSLNQNFEYVFLGMSSTNSGDMTPRAAENDLVGIGGAVTGYPTSPNSSYPLEEAHHENLSNTGYYPNEQAQYRPPYQNPAFVSQEQTYRSDQDYDVNFDAGSSSGTYEYENLNTQTTNWTAESRDNEVIVQEDEPEYNDDISLPNLAEAQQETRQRRESRSDKGKGKKKYRSYR